MGALTRFEHVSWDDVRAVGLRAEMLAELTELYPELAAPTDPDAPRLLAVGAEGVVATVLACHGMEPVGHAAVRTSGDELEVKRVFVRRDARGAGVAAGLMTELEAAAQGAGARRLILHTGARQPAAVRLYQSLGYRQIALYEPYATTMPDSFCFEKDLG